MSDGPLIKTTESATQSAVRWQKRALKSESLLTPRRIDQVTPDGVLVWTDGSWTEASRGNRGTWMCSVTPQCFDPQPKWWLPMLPAPEEE